MGDHYIKVRISDRVYPRTIHSEQEEAAIRKAAVELNEKISALSQKFTGVSVIDILTIVALNEGIEKVELQRRLDQETEDIQKLSQDLENYVSSLK